jgi:PAS domain S-box-containing protein
MPENNRYWNNTILLPVSLLVLGLGLAAAISGLLLRNIHTKASAKFEYRVERISTEIERRFNIPIYGLRGGKGIYAASKSVERDEFRAYVASRDMPREFPGVRGFGFIQRVMRENIDAFIAAERADNAPNFAIHQLAEKHLDELYIIKLIEPAADNKGAEGLDIGSDKIRREAAIQAIETGLPTMTGPASLVQVERTTPGILLYVPVYKKESTALTPSERRHDLVGLMYAPIVVEELLKELEDVATHLVDIKLFDNAQGTASANLFFSSDNTNNVITDNVITNNFIALNKRAFHSIQTIKLPGRTLTLQVGSTPKFEAEFNGFVPILVFSLGTLLSLMLALLIRLQITGRSRAEKLAKKISADLRISEERFAFALEGSGDGVWDLDIPTHSMQVSRRWKEIIGYDEQDKITTLEDWKNLLHPDDVAMVIDNVHAHFAGKILNSSVEYRLKAKEGGYCWVLGRGIVVQRSADGKPLRMVGTHSDITERKSTSLALENAITAADTANRAKSEFLANMSHEIRTPMNAILGMLALLRRTELNQRQEDYASKTEGAARSLLELLNDILDISKAEAGKMELDPQAFRIDYLFNDLSVILSANIGAKPVEIIFEIDPAIPLYLLGDAMRLKQVLINLGGNAIKFTEKGSVVVKINLIERLNAAVTLGLSVRDTGIGIAPENHARIFSGFTQAEASTTRRFGGTGLGIAISQKLIGLMGGRLELESSLGKGCRFFFSIQLPILDDAKINELKTSADNIAKQNDLQRLLNVELLLVEDNLNNQQIALELLEAEGAIVELADNGQKAVDILITRMNTKHNAGFDAILMDLQMPVMDGITATKMIRHDLKLLTLPIIAMTANAMASDRDQCLNAGMNEHLGKPFDVNHLVKVIRAQIGDDTFTTTSLKPAFSAPSTAEELAQATGIDLEGALNRFGGNRDLYLRMLPKFLETLGSMDNQIRKHASLNEIKLTAQVLHTLKGLAATMGVMTLSAEAAKYEKLLANEPSHQEIHHLVEQTCASIASAIFALENLFEFMQPTILSTNIREATTDTSTDTSSNDSKGNDSKSSELNRLTQKEFESSIHLLTQQLKNSDMGSLNSIKIVMHKFKHSITTLGVEEQLNAIDEAITQLDFKQAARLCARLIESAHNVFQEHPS